MTCFLFAKIPLWLSWWTQPVECYSPYPPSSFPFIFEKEFFPSFQPQLNCQLSLMAWAAERHILPLNPQMPSNTSLEVLFLFCFGANWFLYFSLPTIPPFTTLWRQRLCLCHLCIIATSRIVSLHGQPEWVMPGQSSQLGAFSLVNT